MAIIDKPSDYFSTNLWVADDASSRALTGFGHTPAMVWTKHRGSGSINPTITDSVRGGDKQLATATNAAEDSGSHGKISAFGTDGITVIDGTSGSYPKLYFNDLNPFGASVGGNYVGWSWSTGTSFTNDASATGIGSMDSAGSVNEEAGFAIVSYTGNETASTLKHGLSTVPQMIIIKGLISARDWIVGHHTQGWTKSAMLNETNAFSNQTHFNNTAPTSSVFSIEGGTNSNVNTNNAGYISYVFSERQSYSKFGSYTGNGNADGTFIYTGFKPAFVIYKKSSASGTDWVMVDNKRNTFNVLNKELYANLGASEGTVDLLDFTSNGFKCRRTHTSQNESGQTYIYMAFAENPFVASNFNAATAR